jgi:hypothetical protein
MEMCFVAQVEHVAIRAPAPCIVAYLLNVYSLAAHAFSTHDWLCDFKVQALCEGRGCWRWPIWFF